MQDVLRDAEDHDLANTISHFCNCLIGNIQSVSNKGGANSALSKNQKKVQRKRDDCHYSLWLFIATSYSKISCGSSIELSVPSTKPFKEGIVLFIYFRFTTWALKC